MAANLAEVVTGTASLFLGETSPVEEECLEWSSPWRSLESWENIPCGLSNLTPISAEFQLQYEQARIHGPDGGVALALSAVRSDGSGADSRDWTASGPIHIGH